MTKLGRNDPCHCGSGKKYKKCHWDSDRRHPAVVEPAGPDPDPPTASLDLRNLPKRLRQLSETGPARGRKEFSELLAKAEPVIEYMARRDEIEAAAAAMEPHRAEFEELAEDEPRYLALAEAVFGEECFVPLRFTASDVRDAFDQVGHPATLSPDDKTVAILRAAILHVADQDRRSILAMGLLAQLPAFVAAGRHLEAWLVQAAAVETTEYPDESNAFLFEMFSYGYDALTAGKRTEDEAALRRMGFDLDRLRGMSPDELEAWVQAQTADPAKTRALEAFFGENPRRREESVAHLEAMERQASKLLEREDSRFLLVTDRECQPWLPILNERLSQSAIRSETLETAMTKYQAKSLLEETILPLMREMADAIFTPERIRQLVEDLRKYRSRRFAAHDRRTVGLATGAMNCLELEDSPGQNTFLLVLCYRSLTAAHETTMAETDG